MNERGDTSAMRHLIDYVIGDYESCKVAVVVVVFIATRGAVNSGFGLDEWITARFTASHGRNVCLIIRVAVVHRRLVLDSRMAPVWVCHPPRLMSRRFVAVQRHCAVDSLRSVLSENHNGKVQLNFT